MSHMQEMPATEEDNSIFSDDTTKICEQCMYYAKDTIRCACCNATKNQDAFSAEDVATLTKNSSQKQMLCTACSDRGYTLLDKKDYLCEACGLKGGRRKFKADDIKNQQKRGSCLRRLRCKDGKTTEKPK